MGVVTDLVVSSVPCRLTIALVSKACRLDLFVFIFGLGIFWGMFEAYGTCKLGWKQIRSRSSFVNTYYALTENAYLRIYEWKIRFFIMLRQL